MGKWERKYVDKSKKYFLQETIKAALWSLHTERTKPYDHKSMKGTAKGRVKYYEVCHSGK